MLSVSEYISLLLTTFHHAVVPTRISICFFVKAFWTLGHSQFFPIHYMNEHLIVQTFKFTFTWCFKLKF
jgi:hypothetical protein